MANVTMLKKLNVHSKSAVLVALDIQKSCEQIKCSFLLLATLNFLPLGNLDHLVYSITDHIPLISYMHERGNFTYLCL